MTATQFTCGSHGCEQTTLVSKDEADKLSDATSIALRNVLGAELQSILDKGVTIPTLLELTRFANTAQELLMIRSPMAEVRSRNRPAGSFGSNIAIQNPNAGDSNSVATQMSPYQAQYGYGDSDADVQSLTGEFAQNETFGAKMTREIVSALGALKRSDGPSVQELVSGIGKAKKAGLHDVEAKLKASLDALLAGQEGETQVELGASDSADVEQSVVAGTADTVGVQTQVLQ